jgi:hypothetical protein
LVSTKSAVSWFVTSRQFIQSPTFCRNIAPSSSGPKSNPSKKPAETLGKFSCFGGRGAGGFTYSLTLMIFSAIPQKHCDLSDPHGIIGLKAIS